MLQSLNYDTRLIQKKRPNKKEQAKREKTFIYYHDFSPLGSVKKKEFQNLGLLEHMSHMSFFPKGIGSDGD